MEKGLVTFFDVKECGFYRIRRGKDSEYVRGSLSETIGSIYSWVKGRDTDQTIPWCTKRHPMRTQIYCKSASYDEETGDYFFVFWKKYGESNGNVSGVLAKSKVNDSKKDTHKVNTQVKGQQVILGEPMYYWFIPEHNIIASVKLPHSLSDSDNMLNYLKKCVDLRIEIPGKSAAERTVYNSKAGRDVIIKTVSYQSDDKKFSLNFKLSAELKELNVNSVSLSALSEQITHLVVRETITSSKDVKKDSIFSLFDQISMKKRQRISMSKQVEIITEENLTYTELSNIINMYNNDFDAGDSVWDNIGFKVDGVEGSTKWFDKYVERKHVLIEPKHKKDDSYYPAEQFLNEVKRERKSLLDFIAIEKEQAKLAVGSDI
ncbi:hypothetical protein [Shewanella subflava]|uniref:Uncharacterized protein n=1 Tax=Shewanella subflava TaxID=2986476 RepID=A0ABT3I6I9_9GAMM|nr:hypothetical protein [Shewanella subflava]MCW3171666.1 hypothetical protein [Shewanella subflava]